MAINPFRRRQGRHNVATLSPEEVTQPEDIEGPMHQNNVDIESAGQPSGEGLLAPIAFTEPWSNHERMLHLQGRLNHEVSVRLGYSEALAALFRRLDDLPPHPSGVSMSNFVRSSNAPSLPETLHLVVEVIGLERSVDILESISIRHTEVVRDPMGSSGAHDGSGNTSGRPSSFPREPPLTSVPQPITS